MKITKSKESFQLLTFSLIWLRRRRPPWFELFETRVEKKKSYMAKGLSTDNWLKNVKHSFSSTTFTQLIPKNTFTFFDNILICSWSTCLLVKTILITNCIKKVNPEKSRTISKKSRDKNMRQIPSRKIPGSRDFAKIPSRPGMKFLGTLDTAEQWTQWTVEKSLIWGWDGQLPGTDWSNQSWSDVLLIGWSIQRQMSGG